MEVIKQITKFSQRTTVNIFRVLLLKMSLQVLCYSKWNCEPTKYLNEKSTNRKYNYKYQKARFHQAEDPFASPLLVTTGFHWRLFLTSKFLRRVVIGWEIFYNYWVLISDSLGIVWNKVKVSKVAFSLWTERMDHNHLD